MVQKIYDIIKVHGVKISAGSAGKAITKKAEESESIIQLRIN